MMLTFNANIKFKLSLRWFEHMNINNNKLTKIKAPCINESLLGELNYHTLKTTQMKVVGIIGG
jgi:hypothetical protein